MGEKGIDLLEELRQETYGTVVVFQDFHGHNWGLLQLRHQGT